MIQNNENSLPAGSIGGGFRSTLGMPSGPAEGVSFFHIRLVCLFDFLGYSVSVSPCFRVWRNLME